MKASQFAPLRDGRGFPSAVCTCDDCGTTETVRADFDHRANRQDPTPVVSQCVTKLQALGWTYVRKRLRCPSCAEARRKHSKPKFTEEEDMTKRPLATALSELGAALDSTKNEEPSPSEVPPPEPTAKQTRLIMMMLEDVYDDANKRYRGDNTDKTVAEELGDGIRPGWVAQLREKFFGPAGGNEEMEALQAEMADWRAKANELESQARDALQTVSLVLADMDAAQAKVKEFSARLDAICRNVGPKADRK